MSDNKSELTELTTEIVAAYLGRNSVPVEGVSGVITAVYSALAGIGQPLTPATAAEKPAPAVSIKKSVTSDSIVCLECGAKMKMLKRHLATDHGMTPDEYRARWGLTYDYPMVAPTYASARSEMAKAIGLGKKRGSRKS